MVINFGIIGCGKIGIRHIEKLQGLDAKLVSVCDKDESRLTSIAEEYDCRTYKDFNTMLKKEKKEKDGMMVVNICTPSGLHARMSIDALKKGYHVVCEKPMALNIKDAKEMMKVSTLSDKRLFIVKQNRYNPPVIAGKKAIENGFLGDLFYIGVNVLWNRPQRYYDEEKWRGTKKMDGGPLMTQASHFIDLLWWYGGDIRSVYAKSKTFNHNIEVEDTGIVILNFKNGALGHICYTTCMYHKNFEGSILVVGKNGSFKVGGEYLDNLELWEIEGFPKPKIKNVSYRGSLSHHEKALQNVITTLRYDSKIDIPGFEGLKTVEIIEAIEKSHKMNKEIYLEGKK